MKKLAIFAEGGTEQYFIEKLFRSIATERRIRIQKTIIRGGSKFPRGPASIHIDAVSDEQKFFVIIHDCGNDERVTSDIRDNYSSLCNSNFDNIIGIRDAYPKTTAPDILKIRSYLYPKLAAHSQPTPLLMILVLMEIEAWFIAETGHFGRISSRLNAGHVQSILGFDPDANPARVEEIKHPAKSLDDIYELAKHRYDKRDVYNLERTVDVLDCGRIYLELCDKIPALKPLIDGINSFLS